MPTRYKVCKEITITPSADDFKAIFIDILDIVKEITNIDDAETYFVGMPREISKYESENQYKFEIAARLSDYTGFPSRDIQNYFYGESKKIECINPYIEIKLRSYDDDGVLFPGITIYATTDFRHEEKEAERE
jgi:hypothetical protein